MEEVEIIEIEKILEKQLKNNENIIGINIGTFDGNLIAGKNKKLSVLNKSEIVSYSSSIMNLARGILKDTTKRELKYNLIRGKDILVISLYKDEIILIAFVERKITIEENIENFVAELYKLAIKIKTYLEIPEIKKEDIFSLIKKSIPLTLWMAIITKEGLPIKIEANVREALISGELAHLFASSKLLVEGEIDSLIVNGQEGHIIINEIDDNRILAVGIFESNQEKLEVYISKIKEIIDISR